MGRISRTDLLYEGCYAHIFSRVLTKMTLFQDDKDFDKFKEFLLEAKTKAHFRVYHYCLMHTHFHMVVEVGDVALFSEALKAIKRTYTYYFNKKTKRVGPLWRDRFRAMLIEDEGYLNACGLYVEMNPVKANIVARPTQWKHSSSRFYELGSKDDLVDTYEKQELPFGVDLNDDDTFTKGSGVGSNLFQVMLRNEVGCG